MLLTGAVALLLLLAPLKFGTVLGTAGIALFPLSAGEWLLQAWPPVLFPILSGALLVWAVLRYPRPPSTPRTWVLPASWALLLACSLPGLIRTTEWDYAQRFVWHLLGALCLTLTFWWIAPRCGRLRDWAWTAALTALLLVALQAWIQVPGGGLDRLETYVRDMATTSGHTLNPGLESRLGERRAYATFTYPNSLAAHLILLTPVAVVGLWRLGNRIQPPKVSRAVLAAAGTLLLLGALWFTGSRAAFLALGGGAVLVIPWLPFRRAQRLALVAAVVLGAGGGFGVLTLGRQAGWRLSSVEARVHYYRAAIGMFRAHPLTGAGIGEFLAYYLRQKPEHAEATRQPHNFLLAFAGQSGLLGLCAALLVLGTPLWCPLVLVHGRPGARPDDAALLAAVAMGTAAWSLHALTDFNLQLPGTLATFACLPLLADHDCRETVRHSNPRRWLRPAVLITGVLAVSGAWRLPGEHAFQVQTSMSMNGRLPMDTVRHQAERTARLLPWSPYPWDRLARVAEARGDIRTAVEAYGEALARTPHRGTLWRRLALARRDAGDRDGAVAAARRALEWAGGEPEVQELARELGIGGARPAPGPEAPGSGPTPPLFTP